MRWLLLLGLWLCYFSFGAIASSLAPLVPLIQAELEINHAAMGSIMGAWQFVYIGAAIPAGILLDRLGGTRALVIGVAFVALSSFGRAWADGYWTLLLAVMLFGIGGPIVSSGAPKVVTGIFEGSNRGLAMGIYMTGPTLRWHPRADPHPFRAAAALRAELALDSQSLGRGGRVRWGSSGMSSPARRGAG